LTSTRLAEVTAALAGLIEAPVPSARSARAGTAVDEPLILATRLFPSHSRCAGHRQRLETRLDSPRCTLLTAPAGAHLPNA
jgi:hypothetical protein